MKTYQTFTVSMKHLHLQYQRLSQRWRQWKKRLAYGPCESEIRKTGLNGIATLDVPDTWKQCFFRGTTPPFRLALELSLQKMGNRARCFVSGVSFVHWLHSISCCRILSRQRVRRTHCMWCVFLLFMTVSVWSSRCSHCKLAVCCTLSIGFSELHSHPSCKNVFLLRSVLCLTHLGHWLYLQ